MEREKEDKLTAFAILILIFTTMGAYVVTPKKMPRYMELWVMPNSFIPQAQIDTDYKFIVGIKSHKSEVKDYKLLVSISYNETGGIHSNQHIIMDTIVSMGFNETRFIDIEIPKEFIRESVIENGARVNVNLLHDEEDEQSVWIWIRPSHSEISLNWISSEVIKKGEILHFVFTINNHEGSNLTYVYRVDLNGNFVKKGDVFVEYLGSSEIAEFIELNEEGVFKIAIKLLLGNSVRNTYQFNATVVP